MANYNNDEFESKPMSSSTFEVDITRDYPVLDRSIESGVEEVLVIPTANTPEREPTYHFDRWRGHKSGIRAWDYPERVMIPIVGLYWITGVYGL